MAGDDNPCPTFNPNPVIISDRVILVVDMVPFYYCNDDYLVESTSDYLLSLV